MVGGDCVAHMNSIEMESMSLFRFSCFAKVSNAFCSKSQSEGELNIKRYRYRSVQRTSACARALAVHFHKKRFAYSTQSSISVLYRNIRCTRANAPSPFLPVGGVPSLATEKPRIQQFDEIKAARSKAMKTAIRKCFGYY